MSTTELSFLDQVARHDAEVDEQLQRILAAPKPRKPKVIITSPNGIRSKPRAKAIVPVTRDDNTIKKKRASAEARRAALERKQF